MVLAPHREVASTLSPAVSTPEVLTFLLPGEVAPGEVRALLVGSRINLRALNGSCELSELGHRGKGAAFVFRHGAIVLFGVAQETQQAFLEQIAAHVQDPLRHHEIETATIEIASGHEEQVDSHGNISLRKLTPERLLLTATILAQSIALVRHETQAAEIFDRIEPLVAELRNDGSVAYPSRSLMRQIGEVLAVQHRMVGRMQISEKPEVLWDHPELDRFYRRLESEFELTDRVRVIDRKLAVIGESADVLVKLVNDRRSVRLELAIIALIAFEIVVSLVEKVA